MWPLVNNMHLSWLAECTPHKKYFLWQTYMNDMLMFSKVLPVVYYYLYRSRFLKLFHWHSFPADLMHRVQALYKVHYGSAVLEHYWQDHISTICFKSQCYNVRLACSEIYDQITLFTSSRKKELAPSDMHITGSTAIFKYSIALGHTKD